MLALAWRTIKDRKLSLIIYCLAAAIFVWMYVALFPTFADKAEEFDQLMQAYPEQLLDTFGISEQADIFGSIENFLATEQYSFIWPIMVIAMVVAIAGSSIAGEVESGTAELILSQPVSRSKIFFGKYLAGVFNLLVFTIISNFVVVPLALAYNVDYQIKSYLLVSVLGFLFGLAIMSLTFLFSAMFSSKGKAYFIPVGIIILMYVLQILSSLKDSLSDLKYLSFFHYFDSFQVLSEQRLDWVSIWVFLGVAVVTTIVAVIWFNKRDVAIS